MKLCKAICTLASGARRGEKGSILILGALAAVILIGSAGLAVDVSRMYAAKAEISRAVDAAALAGVLEFDGTAAGLTDARNKAYSYLTANDPSITSSCPTAASCITADGSTNKMTIKANKSVKLYFLSLFGFSSASVYGHAVAGFQDQTIDAVMVIDSTASMSGSPITNAKTAATNFKNALLGSNPSGNVYVGIAPLRGCYRPTPSTYSDCVYNTVQSGTVYVKDLTSNSSQLDSAINAVTPGGMSATNVCTGLGKGYEVVSSSSGYATGHGSNPKNRRYLVLLSDGDNVYFGQTVYTAGPPTSPNTYSIGGTNYACAPPNTCSGWGNPCHNGTYSSGAASIASDNFDSNTWTGGSGWSGAWTSVATSNTTNANTPQAGSYHARVASSGSITRTLDLTAYTSATMTFYAKYGGSWSSSNHAYLEISTNGGSNWTTLRDFTTSNTSTSYGSQTSINLDSYTGKSVQIRFRANTGSTSKYLYIDTIDIQNASSEGYLNGQDGQNYSSCSETPAPRERQIDVETLNLANAIKSQGVEIFVVSFSACPDNDGNTVYNTACASQPNPVSAAPASGKVGDTTTETTANIRLAKCIASSTPGTNDHFWYSTDASDLPNIFTTIAAQIAHRLVE